MDKAEYRTYKSELIRKKSNPYYFNNKGLANEFYDAFVKEEPEAKLYCIGSTQAITYTKRAESKLIEDIKAKENELTETLRALQAVRDQIEQNHK